MREFLTRDSVITAVSLHTASRIKSPTLTFPVGRLKGRLTDLSEPRMNKLTRYRGGDLMAYPYSMHFEICQRTRLICRGFT
jgi:hypothetical protein